MCGIFGFVSSKKYKPKVVLDGLKILEYRGYDSWGIAVKDESAFVVEKHIGKIGNATLDSKFSVLNSRVGIGHTRWATHGNVVEKNAHPHLDCTKRLALVHNGIFENYEKIKEGLEKKGHKFHSETDSEVIIHLIEEYLKKMPLEKAVKKAFLQMEGLNAIVVADSHLNTIFALKNGSPLLIGLSNVTVMWSPNVIVLGGSVPQKINFEKVNAYLKRFCKIYPEVPDVVKATLDETGGLYGGLAYLQKLP